MKNTTNIGDIGEITAIKYLQKHDYLMLETNFKFGRFGEVDLIAKKDGITIFIEVKYRSSLKYGSPEEAITKSKLYKCRKTVEYYCKKNSVDFERIRFDVITILRETKSHKITHYKNIEIG